MKRNISIIALILALGIAGFFIYRDLRPTTQESIDKYFDFQVYDETLEQGTIDIKFKEPFNELVAELRNNPDDFNRWVQLGVIKKAVNDFKGAEEIWLYADTLRPGNSITTANLADLYQNFLKDNDKAEEWYLETIKRDKTDLQSARNLANFYLYTLNRGDDAIKILQDALQTNPQSLDTLAALAVTYEETEQFQAAIDTWQQYQQIQPIPEVDEKIQELQGRL